MTISAATGNPIVRKDDPKESFEAAASCNIIEGHLLVARALRIRPAMSHEQIRDLLIQKGHPLSPSAVRTRTHELVAKGLVKRHGTGRTEAGRNCATWVLTDEGKVWAQEIADAAHAAQGRLIA